MDEILYTLVYEGVAYKKNKNKSVYFSINDVENARRHLSKRIARKKIDSWKNYSKYEANDLVKIEYNKFEIIKYLKK